MFEGTGQKRGHFLEEVAPAALEIPFEALAARTVRGIAISGASDFLEARKAQGLVQSGNDP